MDFFDTLRRGCAFGKAKRSREIVFAKESRQQPQQGGELGPGATAEKASFTLDFFGYGSGDAQQAAPDGTEQGAEAAAASRLARKERRRAAQAEEGGPEEGAGAKAASTVAAQKKAAQRREEVAALRRKKRIHVGPGAPDPLPTFDVMLSHGVPEWLVANLRGMGFERPTPIQMQCFPAVMAGSHVLASAPTGSGKTIAFLGPLLVRLGEPGKEFARVLVLDPSRELAKQTLDEFTKLAAGRKWRARLFEKLSGEKAKSIKRLDVAITTPLKLAGLLREKQITLNATRHLVLDEADKLLDLGFAPQIDEILSYCPKDIGLRPQTLMFSATLPPMVCELAGSILTDPLRVSVGNVNAAAPDVTQRLVFITDEDGKLFSFRQLVQEGKVKPPALIFVQSKERAKELFGEIVYDGVFADAIHGDRTKEQRDNSVRAFREGKTWMLICTDVLARGVDFKGVETVVNYDFPPSASTYIHRIGRTGRAGRKGTAITLFTIQDFEALRSIVGVMRQSGCEVPPWMLRLKPQSKKDKRMAERRPPERKRISTTSGWDLQREHKKKQMIEHTKSKKRKMQQEAAAKG